MSIRPRWLPSLKPRATSDDREGGLRLTLKEGNVDMSYITHGVSQEPLYHLSAAIERGDKEEARLLLTKMFPHKREAIEQGRFSPDAKR